MGEGCTAGRDRSGLLGKRGLCCWLGKGGLLGGEAVLIGGRGAGGERWTARWQKAVLLGDRGGLLGGKGMYCWAG